MQLKDKDNSNVMPNTSAANVSYGNSNVAAALAELEQGGGGGSSASPLAGKKICFFGDSITDPFASTGGYPDLVISKVGAIPPEMGHTEMVSADVSAIPADLFDGKSAIYGISGCNSSTVKKMVLGTLEFVGWEIDRFAKHIKVGYEDEKDFTDFDAIVIMIGTNATGTMVCDIDADIPDICVNDINSYPYSYSATGKTIASATLNSADEFFSKCFASTYLGDLAASIEYIRWKNPNCRIFLVTIPPNDYAFESDNPKQYKNVRNMILELADKMSVQVIDAQARAACGLWNIGYWIGNDPFGSGYKIHPNTIGKELWASYIANELNKQWYASNVTTT